MYKKTHRYNSQKFHCLKKVQGKKENLKNLDISIWKNELKELNVTVRLLYIGQNGKLRLLDDDNNDDKRIK